MPLNRFDNADISPIQIVNEENKPVPELVGCLDRLSSAINTESFSGEGNNMPLIEGKHTVETFTVNKHPFTIESVFVKSELDDFDDRKIKNEVDPDLDQKPAIKNENEEEREENFINNQYPISHEEIDVKSEVKEDDVEQPDNWLKTYKCPDCPYQSKYKSNVKKHSIQHRNPDEIVWHHCTECPYKTHNQRNLRLHFLGHSKHQFFKCTQCTYQTKRPQYLKTHQLTHESTDKWHACLQCPFKTIRKYRLKKHVIRVHANPNNLECYMCEQCPYKTHRQYSFKEHLLTHNMDQAKWLQCTCCSYKTLRKSDFRRHQINHHDDEGPADSHKCPECPYKATQKCHLLNHTKNHQTVNQTEWLQCPDCSYRTPQTRHLKVHQMLHTTVGEWFRCFDCPYKTNWKPSLVFHMKIHLQTGQDK